MAVARKSTFFRKFLERRVRDERRWPAYRPARDAVRVELEQSGVNPPTSLDRAAIRVAADVLGQGAMDMAESAWQRKKDGIKRAKATRFDEFVEAGMTAGKTALLSLIEQEKTRAAAEREAERAARVIRRLETEGERVALRRVKAKIKKEELRAQAELARQELYREKRRTFEVETEQKKQLSQDKILASQVSVTVEDEGPADIVRDVRFVYEHLSELILVSDSGVRMLNPAVLKRAPSNGSIALATYALESPSAFIEKFVGRLFPKAAEIVRDTRDTEAEQKDLDPSFDELERYFE